MPEFHRRTIRLQNYDYSQPGGYFVTIVTENRRLCLGEIADGQAHLSAIGHIVETCWHALPAHFPVELDAFVIMPNHLHGILFIQNLSNRRGETSRSAPVYKDGSAHPDASPAPAGGTQQGSLSAILQNFKSVSTRKVNTFCQTPGSILWQRNYYEHVIRTEQDLTAIRAYILGNPGLWEQDPENPAANKSNHFSGLMEGRSIRR